MVRKTCWAFCRTRWIGDRTNFSDSNVCYHYLSVDCSETFQHYDDNLSKKKERMLGFLDRTKEAPEMDLFSVDGGANGCSNWFPCRLQLQTEDEASDPLKWCSTCALKWNGLCGFQQTQDTMCDRLCVEGERMPWTGIICVNLQRIKSPNKAAEISAYELLCGSFIFTLLNTCVQDCVFQPIFQKIFCQQMPSVHASND